jgi:hypothetical protein
MALIANALLRHIYTKFDFLPTFSVQDGALVCLGPAFSPVEARFVWLKRRVNAEPVWVRHSRGRKSEFEQGSCQGEVAYG